MKILMIGAGAVGRGFVAPLLAKVGIPIDFVDTNVALLAIFAGRTEYLSAETGSDGYEFTKVEYGKATTPRELRNISDYEAVFISVGPRNYLGYAQLVRDAKIVFVLENVRNAGHKLLKASRNKRVRFGIPDVIVSSTASPELLCRDRLCTVSERGMLILEAGADDPNFGDAVFWADAAELEKFWACKFFIHNASHAVAAFLGALSGYTFIHEAMADIWIKWVVEQTMQVITYAIIAEGMVEENFAVAYKECELLRFKNPLLFDPISRVARDPMRKLDGNDRLIQALKLVANVGLDPYPIMIGVNAAIDYGKISKDDIRFYRYCQSHSPEDILRKVCGLQDDQLIQKTLEVSSNNYLRFPLTVINDKRCVPAGCQTSSHI